ncbi:uncharacterized protein EV422DRAFT_253008 [Fimicolochytrium jonesii]|uniref:uncharacterized protein n=1 Tax=Fimicolochytrium jonesii TaxID=1396493 RepID=UPI0022FEEE75|nr:uncharacterized protein EV422DRAFT_253008 [Fimicolochytrium jonesii]KAI8825270.1 hypothetical protein EV422DRAFT_253008 [Fimicolochytrium jonesii]
MGEYISCGCRCAGSPASLSYLQHQTIAIMSKASHPTEPVQKSTESTPILAQTDRPLRILVATEYLPPTVSGIANRFKNLIKGYRDAGHDVKIASVRGTYCDIVVPSVPNLFYLEQRMFLCPPLSLVWLLINPWSTVPYDIVHIVSPLCLAFVPLIPLFKIRGVKVYVSYHVLMEYYKVAYFYNKTLVHKLLGDFIHVIYVVLYFIPLVIFADVVGIPSKVADSVVYKYAKRIHFMKSGLDTTVFVPRQEDQGSMDDLLAASATTSVAMAKLAMTAKRKAESRRQSKAMVDALPKYEEHPSDAAAEDEKKVGDINPTADSDGPTLVYIGRLAPEKNVEFLINAMKHPRLATAALVIVGDGPSRLHLEALAATIVGPERVYSHQTKLKPTAAPLTSTASYSSLIQPTTIAQELSSYRIIFTGMVYREQEVAKYYAYADIFVSASASETFGFTVAESLACGTPTVVVREGAFKTVYKVVDEWMFDQFDAEDYVAKIWRCLEDPDARRVARKLAVRCFAVDMAVGDLVDCYRRMLAGG